MLAPLLAPLANLNTRLTQPVHPTLYPFPLATTLHALRVAIAYRTISSGFRARRRAEAKHTPAQLHVSLLRDAAGFLVMAWGGGFISNYILCQIPGQLLTVWPWLNYLSVYLAVSFVVASVGAPSAKLLDLTLPVLDGATRTAATYGGINMVLNHANPAARSSLLLQIIIGTISAAVVESVLLRSTSLTRWDGASALHLSSKQNPSSNSRTSSPQHWQAQCLAF